MNPHTGHPPRRVAVFSLGGTIAMTGDGSGGVVPALSGRDLLNAVPGLRETGIDVDVRDFRRVPSAGLSFDDLIELASAIRRRLDGDGEIDGPVDGEIDGPVDGEIDGPVDGPVSGPVDGVVVTQGTDTIEETAFLLDLLHTSDAPVVVTGAMRHPAAAGPDGPANLLAAVRTAAARVSRGLGCVVVFADEIHAARHVRKGHTTSVSAFVSPSCGPVGQVVEGAVRLLTRPVRGLRVPLPPATGRPAVRIPVVPISLGDDGTFLRLLHGQVDGVVIAALGAGHVPAAMVEDLHKLAGSVPVVLASRTGSGTTLRATYGFPGSEIDLLGRGLVPAGFLDAHKARVLLHLLLAGGAGRDEIVHAFRAAGAGADPWDSAIGASSGIRPRGEGA